MKSNTVAVVSDGSAVLGLGNIGAEAAIPVMEGKCLLLKEFANIDAFPICLQDQDEHSIVKTVKDIAPVFGAINLEDISSPKCFSIEQKLQNIGIPVMHDDQHGTAVVLLAALLNALKVTNKNMEEIKVVINGAGAAGIAVAKMLLCHEMETDLCDPVKELILCDSKGTINKHRKDLTEVKKEIAHITNGNNVEGTLRHALEGADVFIGLSVANQLTAEMVRCMGRNPIIFAMANPIPEIMPEEAKKAGALIVGTGRSDFPNQINNVLGFPGIFRGALDANATMINSEMKLAAAQALSECVKNPTHEKIMPNPLEKETAYIVAKAVKEAAIKTGVIRQ